MSQTPPGLIDPRLGREILTAKDAGAVGARLLGAAQSLAPVEEVFAYRRASEGPPTILATASGLADCAERVTRYAARFHAEDPLISRLTTAPSGAGLVETVRADDIAGRDYRAVCFERPRFVDKLCFAWITPGGWWMVSFYRRADKGVLDLARLGALANLALTAFAAAESAAVDRKRPVALRLESRIAAAFPDLSQRERQVCAATLAGVSADQIAQTLGISRGSVLTYRQRAYRRLGVNQAADLLPALLDGGA